MHVHELRDAGAEHGGKAANLARLIAAGLPVPAGFVIDAGAFARVAGLTLDDPEAMGHALEAAAQHIDHDDIPNDLAREVKEALRELGPLVVVRSSAAIEDTNVGAAPGVFESVRAVPIADVWPAIRAVWASALTPLAAAYARASSADTRSDTSAASATRSSSATAERSSSSATPPTPSSAATVMPLDSPSTSNTAASATRSSSSSASATPSSSSSASATSSSSTPAKAARASAAPFAISVIVQRHVGGELVTVYTRDPRGDDILVQRGAALTRVARDTLPVDIANQHAVLQALRAERAIDAPGGADVELVQAAQQHDDEHVIETWVVQARPIVRRAQPVLVPPPPLVLAQLDDGRTWTWDVAHNPDPLSPAQQGLVERVERAELGASALRMCAGYLYASPRAGFAPPAFDAHALAARAAELEATCTRILAAPPASIADAIERYLAFYAVWANELSPLIASARTASRHDRASATLRVAARSGEAGPFDRATRPSSVQAVLAAAARGELERSAAIARLADLAPAWDVAVAPFGEDPDVIVAAITAFERPRADAADSAHTTDVAIAVSAHDDLAADLAERDDFLFARAQRLVRTALLKRAAELGLRGDTIFWLPLDEVASVDAIDPISAARRAAAAHAAAQRAAHWQMPIVVGPGAGDRAVGEALRGVGSGPRVVGRVVRFASLSSGVMLANAVPMPVAARRDVVVVRAVTPALAVLVAGYAALVSETGGLLDHGAAMARELGITCVVGCRDAWSVLDDRMMVAVDGDAGTIAILDGD